MAWSLAPFPNLKSQVLLLWTFIFSSSTGHVDVSAPSAEMAPSGSIDVLVQQLGSPETRLNALEGLLRLSARGHDVSPCAEPVVRQCLFSPSGTTPSVLALSFDILTAAPSHAFWVDTLSVLVESIQRTSSEAALVALLRIPSLPHSARQHVALNATTAILTTLTSDPSLTARCAAVSAAASLALSNPPLSTVSPDGLNLSTLTPTHRLWHSNASTPIPSRDKAPFENRLTLSKTNTPIL